MKTEFLILFLLVCNVTATALPEPNEAGETIDEPGALLAINSTTLYIFDDDGKPVHVNLEESYSGTEESTPQDIPNSVHFYLYTKKMDPSEPQVLKPGDDDALGNSHFDPKRPTVFITHGWMNSYMSPACTTVRDAYLDHGHYNIIVVDWSALANRTYIKVTRDVVMIGQYVSTMIDYLETKEMSLSRLTIVGHCVGAHIAGISAFHAQNQVNYVVALDPALPIYNIAPPDKRVSFEDAKYVAVIHTNGGYLGFLAPLGHVDYYPNGGMTQPGCTDDLGGACSHARAFLYFAESINTKLGFGSVRCNTYTAFCQDLCKGPTSLMGGADADYDVINPYYLKTNSEPPYARGEL